MKKRNLTILGICLFLLLVSTPYVYGLITTYFTAQSDIFVTVPGLAVYWDENCTSKADVISWGDMYHGETKHHIVYLKNTGNTPLYNLAIRMTNISPATSAYMTLSWNCTGLSLDTGVVVCADLALCVESNCAGGYKLFDIIVDAEG